MRTAAVGSAWPDSANNAMTGTSIMKPSEGLIRRPHRVRRRDLAVVTVEAQRPLHEQADPLLQGQGLEIAPGEPLAGLVAARRHVDVIEPPGGGGLEGAARASGRGSDATEQGHDVFVTPTPSRRARGRRTGATPLRRGPRCGLLAPPSCASPSAHVCILWLGRPPRRGPRT